VLRFGMQDVSENLVGVLEAIHETAVKRRVSSTLTLPSPSKEGEEDA
jgi:hypothetical protein